MFIFTNVLLMGFLLHSVHCDEFSVTFPEQLAVWRGSCLTIPCSFTVQDKYRDNLNGQCTGLWKTASGHRTVEFTRATTGDLTRSNCTTTVHDITEQQAGQVNFRVECDNPLKWTFTQTTLNIKVNDAPPAPTLTPPTLSVTAGQAVSVQCSAPVPCLSAPPTLTWSPVLGRAEEALQQQRDGTFVKVSTLSFTAAASHHEKDITCTAAHRRGQESVSQVSAPLRPLVKYPPRGTTMSLKCSSDAYPAVQLYRWYRADSGAPSLIGSSALLDLKASKDVSHVYCEAENELGTARSDVVHLNGQFPARIVRSANCTGDASEVSCACEAEGSPSPLMQWRFPGLSSNVSITNEALSDTTTRSVITVAEPRWRDAIALVCHSSNPHGSDTQTFTVPAFQRQERPTNTRVSVSPSGPVAEHSDVTLTCSSEASPAAQLYRWYKDDGGTVIGNSAVLNMKASKDITAVFCQAQNDLGTDNSTVTQLNVQYPPRHTTISGHSFGPVTEHDNVTLTCSSEANPAVQHYHWYKADGGALTLIGNSAVVNFRASKDTSSVYCEAQNDLGTDRSTVTQLLVHYKPRNTRVTVEPQTSVREHSDVTLTCSSEASPAAQLYRWYKDDGGTVIGNSAVLNMKASKDITAVFCQAQNELGTENSTVTRLDVQYQPQNTTVTVNPSGPVEEHSNVALTCSSEANPAVQHYHWYKADGGALTLIGNSAVVNFRASKDTSGVYCEAQNDLGTDRSTVTQLLVHYQPRNTRVTVEPQTSVREHSDVTLTCSSEASPAAQLYHWYKDDGGTLIGNSAVLNMKASKDITAVFCEAQNDLGTENSSLIYLDVQYSPRNTTISRLSTAPVTEDDDVALTCSSDARPAAQHYRWYKTDGGDQALIGESAFLIMKASKDITRVFCEALNDLGTGRSTVAHVDVQYGPRNTRVTVRPLGSAIEHSNVTLTCSSDASPAAQLYRWYKHDGGNPSLIGDSAVLHMNASKNTTAVFCEAQNDLGTDRSSITQLDVQYGPRNTVVTVSPSGAVAEHSDVTLTCGSDANPAVRLYHWYKEDGGGVTLIGKSAVLNMKASKDTTRLYCEAHSDLGADNSTVTQLDVLYRPRSTRATVSPSGPVPERHTVSLKCSSDARPAAQRYSWHRADGGHLIGKSPLLEIDASKNITDIFCRAQNDLGADDSSVVVLDVQFPPQILGSSNCTGDGAQIRCSCAAEGKPAPVIQWRLSGISSNHSIRTEALSDTGLRSTIAVAKPLSGEPLTVVCHSSNSLGARQQQLYARAAQAFQQEEGVRAGGANNLLIAIVFILLALVGALLYVIRAQYVRLQKHQSAHVDLHRTDSNELEEETQMNIYTNANEPPAQM